MTGWFRDIRYAVRQLSKARVFTLTAIITLALGIGANSTIFSWMNSTLFSPVPGANPLGSSRRIWPANLHNPFSVQTILCV